MSKKSKKPLFTIVAIAALAGGAFAWYKSKKAKKNNEEEFSDIFEDEDFDSEETI